MTPEQRENAVRRAVIENAIMRGLIAAGARSGTALGAEALLFREWEPAASIEEREAGPNRPLGDRGAVADPWPTQDRLVAMVDTDEGVLELAEVVVEWARTDDAKGLFSGRE